MLRYLDFLSQAAFRDVASIDGSRSALEPPQDPYLAPMYPSLSTTLLPRRGFRHGTAGLFALPSFSLLADERPAIRHPRATDGDDRHEPAWAERLTLTVGPKDADLVGKDDKVIQAAV